MFEDRELVLALRGKIVNIYLSSSWKNRDRVRALAITLRTGGHEVYDFTDPACRGVPEIPPERFPDQFDPEKHVYATYLNTAPEWRAAVMFNQKALDKCDMVVLMLPCGADAHSDWAYAVGKGRQSVIVGHPKAGERTPSHMWANDFLEKDEDVLKYVNQRSYRSVRI